jgi:hypothetical protein
MGASNSTTATWVLSMYYDGEFERAQVCANFVRWQLAKRGAKLRQPGEAQGSGERSDLMDHLFSFSLLILWNASRIISNSRIDVT